MEKTSNSRIITLHRATSLLSKVQGVDMEDYFESAKKSVGSYWEGGGSIRVATGLSFEEQDLLLPGVINCEPGDRGFRKMVEEFYHDISTKVPHKTGVKLEIGLEVDNDKPVSSKNMPINISDYIKWRHHKNHPKVAATKAEADGNSMKEFYFFDPQEVQRKKTVKLKEADEALQIYLKVKSEPEKIDWMLTLLEVDPRSFAGTDEDKLALKLEELKRLSTARPDKFKAVYGAEHLQTMYEIEKMVNLGILLKIGTKYVNAETKNTIGHNMEEAIAYFIDDDNEQSIMLLKAHMQEAERRPFDGGVKKTVLTDSQRYNQGRVKPVR